MQSAFAKREFARMEARAKIEEDMFTRVPLSKTERRRQKATTRSVNSLSQVGDFGDDVADLVEVAEELETKKRTRLVDTVTQLGAKPKKAKAEPKPLVAPKTKKSSKAKVWDAGPDPYGVKRKPPAGINDGGRRSGRHADDPAEDIDTDGFFVSPSALPA